MENTNRSYSNSTNVTVLGMSVHGTSEINIFNHPKFGKIRTATLADGTILLCLSDIAKALGYSNPAKAVIDHCKKGVTVLETPTVNQHGTTVMQPMKYGVEGCMNKLIMRSHLPDAEEFQDWVCYDVLPSIRKTGSYSLQPQYNVPQSFSEALQLAADQAKQIEEQQKEIEQKDAKIIKLQPKANFAEAAFKSEGKVDIGQAAKILGLPFGRTTLFKKLREAGVFFANRNEPKQKYIDAGYFEMTLLPPIHRDNHPDILYQKVLCNPKGLAYINHLFGGIPSDGKLAKIR